MSTERTFSFRDMKTRDITKAHSGIVVLTGCGAYRNTEIYR
jgi:hypothetical protein